MDWTEQAPHAAGRVDVLFERLEGDLLAASEERGRPRERQDREWAGRQKMLLGAALVIALVCRVEHDRRLIIGPAAGRDTGVVANARMRAIGGNHKPRGFAPFFNMLNTPFLSYLEAAGYPADSIDMVLCTHLHLDHVGWNTRLEKGKWAPTFRNASGTAWRLGRATRCAESGRRQSQGPDRS